MIVLGVSYSGGERPIEYDWVMGFLSGCISQIFVSMTCIGYFYLTLVNQTNEKLLAAQRAKTEMELKTLRQNIEPHFLFNSLNSISALTAVQPEKARHMINQLSEFLRGTLKKDEKQWNTLQEEMQYLELYLEIEKVRFGYRLQTDINCEEAALELKLPSLLLQPVVENAIKLVDGQHFHGPHSGYMS